ncbi:MAG: signal peptide peptidase SppA [candidate division Zixibacteria bacterium]|nr:signal peptide peptidase SppA [candidate division Zixibacteria bacterium]
MARRRDIIVAVIIACSFLVVFGFVAMVFIGVASSDGDISFGSLGGSVGVIPMFGIMEESSGRPVIEYLDRWRNNSSIKAIVVHVNSPGGGTAISQEIHDAILRAREDKPVVVSMAEVAASGGYYIACAADRIVANPGTVTGSIGVIMSFHTYEEVLDKIGIGTEIIKSGKFKDVGNYSRQMTAQEGLMLRAVVMDGYEQFVAAIAEGRDMELEEVYALADGSIFTGLQAQNLGLVDTLGGLNTAVNLAATLAGIDEEPDIVRPKQPRRSYLVDMLTGLLGDLGSRIEGGSSGPRLMYLYQ